MKPGLFAAVVVAVFLLGFAVGRGSALAPVAAVAPPAPGPGSVGSFPGQPTPVPSMMEEGQSVPAVSVTGVIQEVIQVPNYTYLRLTTERGEEWAAVNATMAVQKGQTASIGSAALMRDFASSTLKRTFERIWFGQLQPSAGAVPATVDAPSSAGAGAAGFFKAPSSSAAAGALEAIKKAEGPLGLRVSDVFAERQALAGKTVRVRGLVTKVTPVQGVNYVHVKDGSGAGDSGDDDLTVVTQAAVKVDAVVTLEGRVAVDKDLGMGKRPVVVEDATILEH